MVAKLGMNWHRDKQGVAEGMRHNEKKLSFEIFGDSSTKCAFW